MPVWLRSLVTVLSSEALIEPLILMIVAMWMRQYNRSRAARIMADITIDIVDYIEEHYKQWGIKGSAKMDRFLELFSEEFKRQLGRAPSADEIEVARMKAEAYVQRARRQANSPRR